MRCLTGSDLHALLQGADVSRMATATDRRVGFHSNVQGLGVRQGLSLPSDRTAMDCPGLGLQEMFAHSRAFRLRGSADSVRLKLSIS